MRQLIPVFLIIIATTFVAGTAPASDQAPMIASIERTSSPAATAAPRGMEFVPVKGGCFCMGANVENEGSIDALPVHEVCVDDYAMAKYEVTEAQWRAVMGSGPDAANACGDDCPMVNVSWKDVQTFVSRLNRMTGKTYRLPTEAEWEYAARRGANGNSVEDANHALRPVGQTRPNSMGIYGMKGSVWEWTGDRYNRSYYRSSPKHNPAGPMTGAFRVLRGGSWIDTERVQQPAFRIKYSAADARPWIGFRLIETNPLSAERALPDDRFEMSDGAINGQCGIVQQASIR